MSPSDDEAAAIVAAWRIACAPPREEHRPPRSRWSFAARVIAPIDALRSAPLERPWRRRGTAP